MTRQRLSSASRSAGRWLCDTSMRGLARLEFAINRAHSHASLAFPRPLPFLPARPPDRSLIWDFLLATCMRISCPFPSLPGGRAAARRGGGQRSHCSEPASCTFTCKLFIWASRHAIGSLSSLLLSLSGTSLSTCSFPCLRNFSMLSYTRSKF